MTSALPDELWLHVFGFLSWRDKLNVRRVCAHFRSLLDASRPLWRGFGVALRDFARYDRRFWRSLARRRVENALVRAGDRKHLRQLSAWLPALRALRLDGWSDAGGGAEELRLFRRLQRLSVTNGLAPLRDARFLFPLARQLTQLSLCHVPLACAASHLLAAVGQLVKLTSLLLHHDGGLRVASLGGLLTRLTELRRLSWTMVAYKALTPDFFSADHVTAGGALPLSDLQLLDYDAAVTPEVLRPLSGVRSLSVFHLYSVPGPACHLRTWLTALPQLGSLSVHGGHPLAAYADLLPSSLVSLTLCVDLQPEDLQVVSRRAPRLRHLHLEPWGSSSDVVRLLPQLFPDLRTLGIRHQHVSDGDFLCLQQLQRLHTLRVLDAYHRPDPGDPGWVVYEPSSRLLRLQADLQRLTDHRVQVVTGSRGDLLACRCV